MKQMEPPNLFFRGLSMKGTFKPGDKLCIEKIPFEKVRKGDTIIFRIEKRDEVDFVVHRVMDIGQGCLTTRGDNTCHNDAEPIIEENFIGRVTRYERNGIVNRAWNGRMGMLRARALHVRLHIIRVFKFFLRKPYIIVRKTGIVAKLWHPEIEIIHFDTPNGPLVKYVRKGKTITMYLADNGHWTYHRPYDLIIELKQKRINSL